MLATQHACSEMPRRWVLLPRLAVQACYTATIIKAQLLAGCCIVVYKVSSQVLLPSLRLIAKYEELR